MHQFDSGRGLKMKKLALIISIFVFSYLFIGRLGYFSVRAQSLTSDRAYSDYQYNLTLYTQAFSDYQDAVNAYKDNQTLALKENARQKTLSTLKIRDQLLIVYLTALRAKISESNGLSSDDKNNIFGKIDSEVSWYKDHQNSYGADDDLPTLFNKNGDAQNRYKNNSSPVIYESLFDISLGTEADLRQKHEEIYSSLKDYINQGVQSGKLSMDPFNHWILDIDSVDQTLKDNESAARSKIAQLYTQYYASNSSYNSAIQILTSSIKSLTQFNQFLGELTTSLKNQQ